MGGRLEGRRGRWRGEGEAYGQKGGAWREKLEHARGGQERERDGRQREVKMGAACSTVATIGKSIKTTRNQLAVS